jgi:serine/threonine protein kinase
MTNAKTICTGRGHMLTEIKVVGSGAQGTASLVKDKRGKIMVLKEIVVHKWSEQSKLEAQKEVDAMQASCKHPNIINYFGSWFREYRLFILMEYAPNGSLDMIIKEYKEKGKMFMQTQVIHYTQQLSSALDYCHREINIIHRDIKPGNILVDKLGNLKLGDFGLSKHLNKDMICATCVGSPLYMAPEILRGEGYTHGVDIWALGCVVYELMTLESPWTRRKSVTSMAGLINIILCDSPDFAGMDELYSSNLLKIVKWMLQKTPKKRATAYELTSHFEVRAPPDFLNSILPAQVYTPARDQECHRQALREDEQKYTDAASVIQRSLRQSWRRKQYDSQRHVPNEYIFSRPSNPYQREDIRPCKPRARPIAVPKRHPVEKLRPVPVPAPLPAAPPISNTPNDGLFSRPPLPLLHGQDSAKKIQQAFRLSRTKKQGIPDAQLPCLAPPSARPRPPPLPRIVSTDKMARPKPAPSKKDGNRRMDYISRLATPRSVVSPNPVVTHHPAYRGMEQIDRPKPWM